MNLSLNASRKGHTSVLMPGLNFRHAAVVGTHHWQTTELSNALGITSIYANSPPFSKSIQRPNTRFPCITSPGPPNYGNEHHSIEARNTEYIKKNYKYPYEYCPE